MDEEERRGPTRITAAEFEAWYAANSEMTVAELRAAGRVVWPCDCGEEICAGWQMIPADLAESFDRRFRQVEIAPDAAVAAWALPSQGEAPLSPLEDLLHAMRGLTEAERRAAPWREWARRNPVRLQSSDLVEPTVVYVANAEILGDRGHVVICRRRTFETMLHAFGVPEQELVEFIAWRGAELAEPGDQGVDG